MHHGVFFPLQTAKCFELLSLQEADIVINRLGTVFFGFIGEMARDGKSVKGLKLYHFSAVLPSSGLHCSHF